jgi:hypothetical protein
MTTATASAIEVTSRACQIWLTKLCKLGKFGRSQQFHHKHGLVSGGESGPTLSTQQIKDQVIVPEHLCIHVAIPAFKK